MKGRLQSYAFPREWKEPSGAGCYASLQTATALGSVPHHPRVSSANKMVRRLQSGGCPCPPGSPYTEAPGSRDTAVAGGLERATRMG